MPSTNAAELLIRIGADPSGAEANLRRFRESFGRELTGLGTDIRRWAAQGMGDFKSVDQTTQALASHLKLSVTTVNSILERNRNAAQLWKNEVAASFAEVLNASQFLEMGLTRSFMIFDSALGVNVANAIVWQKSIGEAFQKAALQAVGAIAQEALVRAIQATALGFYLLAIQDYRGAALAFKSAAIYGAVGGAAGGPGSRRR